MLAEARELFESGDTRTAVILVQNLLQDDGSNAGARVLLGRIALAAGDLQLARTQLETARDLGIPPGEIAVDLARTLIELNQPAAALTELDAIAETNRNADYWTIRGRALTASGDYGGAAQALDQAAAGGDSAPLLVERARLALALGDQLAAQARLDEALGRDARFPEALALRGLLATTSGALAAGEADLRAAAEIFGERGQPVRAAPVLLRLVQVQLALNEIDLATESANRLSAAIPNEAFADYANGLVAFQRGDFERTVQLLRLALSKAPAQPQFMSLLGAAYLAVGSLGQAEQQFISVLSANPADPAARRLLAETRIRQERPEAALQALESADASAFDQDIGLLILRSIAHLQAGNPEEAIPFLEQAAAIEPTNQIVVFQLARAYSESGRGDEAYAVLQSSPALTLDEAYMANVLVLLSRLQSDGVDSTRGYVDGLLDERPNDAGTHMLAAIFHQLTGQVDSARGELERAVEIDGTFLPARLAMAQLLASEGRASEAEAQLREIIGIDSGHVAALMALAQLAAQRGDAAAAESYLVQAADGSESAAPRLALARLYAVQGDVERAGAQADLAAELSPSQPELTSTRGMIALAAGDVEEAVELLRAARAEAPNQPRVALLLAQAQAADGDLEGARDTLVAAVDEMPTVIELRVGLGEAQIRLGNMDDAIRIARELQEEAAQQGAGFALEGQVRTAERRYTEAARLFESAYQRDRTWPLLLYLVSASRLSDEPGDEVALVRDWLNDSPGDVAARLFLAELLRNEGSTADALEEYTRVIELDDGNIIALNNAAWFSHELSRPRALEYAQRAVDLAPENAAVLDTLGWILTLEEQAGNGIAHLERATQLAPQAVEIRYHLGVAQAQLGRTEAARRTLTAVLEDEQPFAERDAAEALLGTL